MSPLNHNQPIAFVVALPLLAIVAAAQTDWRHLSTAQGILAVPGVSTEQTATVVADFDRDGRTDFAIGMRRAAPSVVWYRRTSQGWDRIVVDPDLLQVEAGGAVCDIDGDGDVDIVFGGDGTQNQLWWWENPHPSFDPAKPWKRRFIKAGGANAHHDIVFTDAKGTGRPQLFYWNQGSRRLFMAEIPENPRESGPWPAVKLLDTSKVATANKQEGLDAIDLDGDGRLDLLAGMYWLRLEAGNKFEAHHVVDFPGRIAGGRFKPGKLAQIILTAGDVDGPVRYYECMGDPTRKSDWKGRDLLDRKGVHVHSLQVADIDGDGHLDIFAAEMAKWGRRDTIENPNAQAWIWYGDGQGNFRRTVFQQGFGFHEAKLADLNGDGRLDVLSKPYTWKAPRLDIWLQMPAPPAARSDE